MQVFVAIMTATMDRVYADKHTHTLGWEDIREYVLDTFIWKIPCCGSRKIDDFNHDQSSGSISDLYNHEEEAAKKDALFKVYTENTLGAITGQLEYLIAGTNQTPQGESRSADQPAGLAAKSDVSAERMERMERSLKRITAVLESLGGTGRLCSGEIPGANPQSPQHDSSAPNSGSQTNPTPEQAKPKRRRELARAQMKALAKHLDVLDDFEETMGKVPQGPERARHFERAVGENALNGNLLEAPD